MRRCRLGWMWGRGGWGEGWGAFRSTRIQPLMYVCVCLKDFMCLTGSICKLLLGSRASKLRSYLIPFILDPLEPDNRSYYVPPINSSTTLFCRIGTVYLLAVLASRTVCFSSPHFREFQRPILHTWCLKYWIARYSPNRVQYTYILDSSVSMGWYTLAKVWPWPQFVDLIAYLVHQQYVCYKTRVVLLASMIYL